MGDECQGSAPADDSGTHASGAGAVALARPVALGPRLDRLGHGGGPGKGPTHHRPMGRRLRRGRSGSLDFRAVWGFPPSLGETQQADLKAAAQGLPGEAGIELANWTLRQAQEEGSAAVCPGAFGISLSRSTCLNYLHRLGFVLKCPKKRLVKADEGKREAFVSDTPPCGTRRTSPEPRYSSPTRPIPGPMRNCGANGCCGESRPWWTRAARAMAKGQLLLGGVPGERGGGVDGAGGEQQLRNVGLVPETTEREARRAAARDLGQRSGAPRRGGAGIPRDTRLGTAAGESAGLQP